MDAGEVPRIPVFLDSPQYEPPALSAALGCTALLKVETLNPVRSFKGRGTETVMAGIVEEAVVPGAKRIVARRAPSPSATTPLCAYT